MPLAPHIRRERRAYHKPPVKLPRRRCKNCPKSFQPKNEDQLHCSVECRKDWHKYQGAYAHIREILPRLFSKELRRQLAILVADYETRITRLEFWQMTMLAQTGIAPFEERHQQELGRIPERAAERVYKLLKEVFKRQSRRKLLEKGGRQNKNQPSKRRTSGSLSASKTSRAK